MDKKPIIPVEVGQIRIDPDPRMIIRDVKILEVGLTKRRWVYRNGVSMMADDPVVLVQRGGMGTKVKIAVRRIERWPVKP